MAKKRRKKNELPSGNYRVQVLDYTDVDGKKHYKSFTAPTKAEAQFLAAEWKKQGRRKEAEADGLGSRNKVHRSKEERTVSLNRQRL